MIFGFDLDGVLYPWHFVAWEWYKRTVGDRNMSFDDFWKYPDGWVSNHQESDIVAEMVKDEANYIAVPYSPYVLGTVQDIANNYADKIYYITGRPTAVKDATRKHLIKLPQAENLYFSDENGGKLQIIKELGCDYYAEDRPKYLEILPAVTSVFAVTTPYNTYREWNAIRISHVTEIPEHLERLNESK